MSEPTTPAFTHLVADLLGVPAAQLREPALVSGLLIAGAGAAGLTAFGAPVAQRLPNGGLAAILLLEHCHISAHAIPERELLLLDVVAPVPADPRVVLDVFARRLAPREIRSEARHRG